MYVYLEQFFVCYGQLRVSQRKVWEFLEKGCSYCVYVVLVGVLYCNLQVIGILDMDRKVCVCCFFIFLEGIVLVDFIGS